MDGVALQYPYCKILPFVLSSIELEPCKSLLHSDLLSPSTHLSILVSLASWSSGFHHGLLRDSSLSWGFQNLASAPVLPFLLQQWPANRRRRVLIALEMGFKSPSRSSVLRVLLPSDVQDISHLQQPYKSLLKTLLQSLIYVTKILSVVDL